MSRKTTTAATNAEPAVAAAADPIPNPPGGGRWKWDETNREWISLDPKPESDEQAAE